MTPAEVVAACDARQGEVETSHASWRAQIERNTNNRPVDTPSADRRRDADLAVVALVRGVAEVAQDVMRRSGYSDARIAASDSPSHIWRVFERAAAVAAGWGR